MTQLTQPEPPTGRRTRRRSQVWSIPPSQMAQSSDPSHPMGFDGQTQVAQQSGPSGQPDPIDLLAARFSDGRSAGPSGGAPASTGGYTRAPSSGYGYGVPTGSYGAPHGTGTLTGGYGAPHGAAAPARSYGAPYGTSGYGTGAPSSGYEVPTGSYGAPAGGYGTAAPYGTGAPAGGYGTAAPYGTGAPNSGYGASYGTGIPSGYGPSASNGYVGVPAPNNRYGVVRSTVGYGGSMPYGATYRAPRYGGRTCAAALILGFVVNFHGVILGGGFLFALGQAWHLWKIDDGTLLTMLPFELGGVITAVIACHALGGASLMRPQLASVVDTFRRLRWLVVVSGIEVALQLYAFATEGYSLSPNWPLYFLHILLLCTMIGTFEEIAFRGIILNGLLAPLGERRDGILKALLISSFLFGAAHLVGQDTDWSDRLQATQAILKVVQTGTLGFAFGVCAIHQHNLTGVAVFHGFTDFVLMVLPYMLAGPNQDEVQYVTADSKAAMATIMMYSVLIVLYIPAIISAMRTLRQEQLPQCGEFMDPSWTSASFGARPAFAYS